jgi:hypothetical protein
VQRKRELEGEKGAAATLSGDELEKWLELAASVGEAVPVAVRELSNLFDRGEEPTGKLLAADGVLRSERRQAITGVANPINL